MSAINLVLESDSSDDDDTSVDSSDDGMDGTILTGVNVIGTFLMTIALSSLLSIANTCGNVHRDREGVLAWLHSLDDIMFRRQFRLERIYFYYVLEKCFPFLDPEVRHAINSSGSAITAELKLAITLRILAGASYLDMIHYHVHVDSVQAIVWEVVQIIHRCLDNI